MSNHTKKPKLKIASYENPVHISEAIEVLSGNKKNKKLIIAQLYGVFGIWLNGEDEEAAVWARQLKKDLSTSKKFSSMMFSSDFFPMVNADVILPSLKHWFSNDINEEKVNEIRNLIGTMFHIRAPIKLNYIKKIPSTMLGTDGEHSIMHNLDPHNHPISNLIKKAKEKEIKFVAISSLNAHEEKEIVDFDKAYAYSSLSEHVGMIFKDHTHKRQDIQGSFSIVDIKNYQQDGEQPIGRVIREGWMKSELIEKMLNVRFDTVHMKQTKYPHSSFILSLLSSGLEGKELKDAIALYLEGVKESEIRKKMKI